MQKSCITIYKKDSTAPLSKTVKFCCLGDSITNGVRSNTDPTDGLNEKGTFMPYYRWWEKEYDIEAVNFGQNGSFIADYGVIKTSFPNTSRAFVLRYAEMPSDADIITILGGVNDCMGGYFSEREFGSPKDKSNTETNTFCGALRTLLDGLKKKYPTAPIVYLTPLKVGPGGNYVGNHLDLPHYIDAIKTICADFEIPVIDLYTPEELNFCNTNDDQLIYGDRLHFGYKAHKALSEYIFSKLEELNIVNLA